MDLAERDEGRKRGISVIMDEIRRLGSDVSGLDRVNYTKAVNGPPVSPPVSFRLFGDNYGDLREVSRAIREELGGYPELLNIRDNLETGSPELQIRVDPERASRYGLTVADVGNAIRIFFDGITASTLFWDNEIIDVVVRYRRDNIDTVFDLENFMIPTQDGRKISFSSVASLEQNDTLSSIKRVDGKREITIEADAYTTENGRAINRYIKELFNDRLASLYPEIELVVGGEFSEFNELLIQILRLFLLGVFLIYLILGTQFRSYTQPFIILLTVPFAFTGVVLFLFASGTPFSTTVLYAGVALAGIAVNDSIVLMSFINEVRRGGAALEKAVKEAAITRLRPIILTSLTTISGLLPVALGLGGRSVVWGPMASTIIFGLIFSTMTTLLFIPSLYGLLYDRKKRRHLKGIEA